MNPFGGSAFDQLNRLGKGDSRGQRQENVKVILSSAHGQRFHAILPSYATHKRPEAFAKLACDRSSAFLRAENAMNEIAHVRVGHVRLSPFQSPPLDLFETATSILSQSTADAAQTTALSLHFFSAHSASPR
jgi:hypothetical protein